jgi:hypothetical protein
MTPPFQPTPSRTKYLHLEATATEALFTGTGYRCGGATTSYSRNIVSDVNPQSGVKTTSGSQTSPIDIGFSTALDSLMGMAGQSFLDLAGMMMQFPAGDTSSDTVVCTANGFSIYGMYDGSPDGSSTIVSWDLAAGSFSRVTTQHIETYCNPDGAPDPLLAFTQTDVETLTISDTSLHYKQVLTGDGYVTDTKELVCNLSSPNTDASVYSDAVALAALWDLDDDMLYPWRTDNSTGLAPLVTRSEVGYDVAPDPGDPFDMVDPSNPSARIPWIDPNAARVNGSVIGAPQPAGYGYLADGGGEGIFDFRHATYSDCPPVDDSPVAPSVITYGARTPGDLPKNCPQWTPDEMQGYFPAGKWVFYGALLQPVSGAWSPTDGIGLWVQDWLQTEDTWQSYDFARPAGADRFAFFETNPDGSDAVWQVVSGYSAGTGDSIVLCDHARENLTAGRLIVNSGDVWGGASVGGFYNVTKTADDTVLIGSKVFNVPTGWSCPSGDMTTAFGRLRFPACPGILGRAKISAITKATLCHLTVESSPGLATNLTNSPPASELVDLCDAAMTALASNVAVTRVGDTEFTVPNSGATAYATIAAAKYIVAHGAAAYYWDDNMPKGHVVTLEFGFDYRLYNETRRFNAEIAYCATQSGCDCSPLGSTQTEPFSEYSSYIETQLCVPFTQCEPRVVRTLDFPGDFAFDEQYGSRWQGVVISAIRDPLWQKPHIPPMKWDDLNEVYYLFSWSEDDGSCQADIVNADTSETTTVFYAHGPVVEAFNVMPTAGLSGTEAAPALPAGVTIGFLSPVDHGGLDAAYAPTPGGLSPWFLHQNLCANSIGDCRFSAIYGSYIVDC